MKTNNTITRKAINEAIDRLRKGITTTNSNMTDLMDAVLDYRDMDQTVKEWRDAAYYGLK